MDALPPYPHRSRRGPATHLRLRGPAMTDLTKRTPAQLRQLLAAYVVSGQPLRLTVAERGPARQYDVELVGIAQEERRQADPYSQRGSLLICRFYATKGLLSIALRDLQSL